MIIQSGYSLREIVWLFSFFQSTNTFVKRRMGPFRFLASGGEFQHNHPTILTPARHLPGSKAASNPPRAGPF